MHLHTSTETVPPTMVLALSGLSTYLYSISLPSGISGPNQVALPLNWLVSKSRKKWKVKFRGGPGGRAVVHNWRKKGLPLHYVTIWYLYTEQLQMFYNVHIISSKWGLLSITVAACKHLDKLLSSLSWFVGEIYSTTFWIPLYAIAHCNIWTL